MSLTITCELILVHHIHHERILLWLFRDSLLLWCVCVCRISSTVCRWTFKDVIRWYILCIMFCYQNVSHRNLGSHRFKVISVYLLTLSSFKWLVFSSFPRQQKGFTLGIQKTIPHWGVIWEGKTSTCICFELNMHTCVHVCLFVDVCTYSRHVHTSLWVSP